jgi:hypothetical protein
MGQDGFFAPFNGQMKSFAVSFCDGAYRTDNFENLYEGDLISSISFEPIEGDDCNYPCETCESGATDMCLTCKENRAGTPHCECIDGYFEDENTVCTTCSI